MRKNNKGFTLIELLAVIVILAIIALIATPLIMNIINDVKEGAAKDSAYAYVKAVELELTRELMENPSGEVVTTYTKLTAPVKGTKPSVVNLSLYNGEVMSGTITFVDYTVTFAGGQVTTAVKN